MDRNIASPTDFDWVLQLRYYWKYDDVGMFDSFLVVNYCAP